MRGQVRRQGLGLANTLGMTALISMVAFVCVGASFAHLTVSSRVERLAEAESVADAVLHLASARLLQQPSFGVQGPAQQRSLVLTLPQGSARLTFDPQQARSWGIPVSLNNLENESSAPGYRRTLPPQMVQLLAEGRSGGSRRLVEVLISQPPFKWAVASTGPVHSAGGLKVFAVKDLSRLVLGVDNLPPDQILPGHILSDHPSAQALSLDSTPTNPSLITGDAQTVGSVALGASTTVQGQVKQHADPSDLPEVLVERYDPEGIQGLQALAADTHGSGLDLSGIWRRQGNLTVAAGGLNLEQGYLYVDGNLEIQGGVTGKGAIFATGNVVIRGMSRFSSDSLQAVVAGGDLTIEGSSPQQSSFQGLLMGGKSLRARHLTLAGSLLGANRDPEGSAIELEQVNLVSNPAAISLDFPELFTPPNNPVGTGKYLMQGGGQIQAQMILAPHLTSDRFYDPVADRLDPDRVTAESVDIRWVQLSDGAMVGSFLALDPVYGAGNDPLEYLRGRENREEIVANLKQGVAMADQLYQRARSRGLQAGRFSLDPNTFIQTSDKMRRMLWRVLE